MVGAGLPGGELVTYRLHASLELPPLPRCTITYSGGGTPWRPDAWRPVFIPEHDRHVFVFLPRRDVGTGVGLRVSRAAGLASASRRQCTYRHYSRAMPHRQPGYREHRRGAVDRPLGKERDHRCFRVSNRTCVRGACHVCKPVPILESRPQKEQALEPWGKAVRRTRLTSTTLAGHRTAGCCGIDLRPQVAEAMKRPHPDHWRTAVDTAHPSLSAR